MSGPAEPTSSVAEPPFGPRHSSRGAPAGSTSAGCWPDTWTRSATEAPSAAATLHSVAIDGFAWPFSIWTSMPLLTPASAASRSSDSRRSARRSRMRLDTMSSSWRSFTIRSIQHTDRSVNIMTDGRLEAWHYRLRDAGPLGFARQPILSGSDDVRRGLGLGIERRRIRGHHLPFHGTRRQFHRHRQRLHQRALRKKNHRRLHRARPLQALRLSASSLP